MNILQVQSLPISDVIANIAKALKTNYTEDCGEYKVTIPEASGEGFIRGINFNQGLALVEYDCMFHETTEVHFTLDKVHPLKFIFCLKGTLNHSFQETAIKSTIRCFQNILVCSSSHNGHILTFEEKKRVKMNSLEVDRVRFAKKFSCNLGALDHTLRPLFEDIGAKQLFHYHGNYSLRTADIIYDMNQYQQTGFLRTIRLESKALEILVVQIEQYEDDQKMNSSQDILRQKDIEQIKKVVKQLKSSVSERTTLRELSKETGINGNKLQKGFKYLYGDTVNDFIKKYRLKTALELLRNSDKTISEISYAVGFANSSYLSKLFREKYGITPKEFRKGFE